MIDVWVIMGSGAHDTRQDILSKVQTYANLEGSSQNLLPNANTDPFALVAADTFHDMLAYIKACTPDIVQPDVGIQREYERTVYLSLIHISEPTRPY